MESLQHVTNLITQDTWLASVDLNDAFFTIPVHKKHRKYFRFKHEGILYEFYGIPNGFEPAMRLFTKQLQPVFRFLRNNVYIYS